MAEAATPRTLAHVESRLAIIHDTAVVSSHAVVGSPAEWHDHETLFPAVIGERVVVREFARVHAGCERQTLIGAGTLIMAGAHIGHDVRVGEHCNIAPNAVICGLVTLGDNVKVGAGAVIRQRVKIGDNAVIGANAMVTKDVPAGETWSGVPAKMMHRKKTS